MLHGPLATPQPAAYLHPLANATQVGHILRAAANAARAAELSAAGDPDVEDALIEQARRRATPALIDVLDRYPPHEDLGHLSADVPLRDRLAGLARS
jgi:hypothetical protein